VGGQRAEKGEFPWQIMLNRLFLDEQTGQEMMELCGGTIINEEWVLTAAHCTQGTKASEYTVKLGILDMTTSNGYKASVSKVIHHQQFQMNEQTGLVKNDIALVKLSGKIDFQQYTDLEPVCLAQASTSLTTTCLISGYGYTAYNAATKTGTQATHLNYATEPLTDNSHCTKLYPYFNATQNVCAGGTTRGGTGTCMGDSGGPLQCKGSDGKYYQVGVVSYGMPCALANDADVFTKVSNYIQWIEDTMDSN
jgi:secreted trypsin-like serine protease